MRGSQVTQFIDTGSLKAHLGRRCCSCLLFVRVRVVQCGCARLGLLRQCRPGGRQCRRRKAESFHGSIGPAVLAVTQQTDGVVCGGSDPHRHKSFARYHPTPLTGLAGLTRASASETPGCAMCSREKPRLQTRTDVADSCWMVRQFELPKKLYDPLQRTLIWIALVSALGGGLFFVVASTGESPTVRAATSRGVYSVVPNDTFVPAPGAVGVPLVTVPGPIDISNEDPPVDSAVIIPGNNTPVPEQGGVVVGPGMTFPDGLFTFATTGASLEIGGSNNRIDTESHVPGSLQVRGAANKFSAYLEYGGLLAISGVGHVVDGNPTTQQLSPTIQDVSKWNAVDAAALYPAQFAVLSNLCVNGLATVSPAQVAGKVAYFGCDVSLNGAGGKLQTTIVAEGNVTFSGAGMTIDPVGAGLVALSKTKGVKISGAGSIFTGGLEASKGTIMISGASNQLACHLVADRVAIQGSSNVVNKCLL
jgi:hypothetical protein